MESFEFSPAKAKLYGIHKILSMQKSLKTFAFEGFFYS